MRKFEKRRNKNFAGIQFENWPIERISIPLSFPSYSSITNRSTLRFERRKEEKTERNEINRESLLFSVKTILQKKEHASSLEMQFRRGKRRKRGFDVIGEFTRCIVRKCESNSYLGGHLASQTHEGSSRRKNTEGMAKPRSAPRQEQAAKIGSGQLLWTGGGGGSIAFLRFYASRGGKFATGWRRSETRRVDEMRVELTGGIPQAWGNPEFLRLRSFLSNNRGIDVVDKL